MADSNLAVLRYVPETVWGTTPTAPLKTLRFTGESLNHQKQTVLSEEIVNTRDVADIIRVGQMTEGGANFEFSWENVDDLIAGVLQNNWTADVITNGNTARSFTFEKQFGGLAQAQFLSARGCRIGSLSLNLEAGSILNGTFSVMGRGMVRSATTVGTGAATAAPTGQVVNAVEHVTGIQEGGATLSGVLGLSLNIENSLRAQPAIGSLDPTGIGVGTCVISGSARMYFRDSVMLEKYLDHTISSLEFTIEDTAGNSYLFEIPSLYYTESDVPRAEGLDGDVFATLNFTARRDPSEGYSIQVTRTAAGS